MKKLIALLSLVPAVAFANPYDMVVTKVIDGDTIKVDVSSWILPEFGNEMSIRVNGIDTPEKGWRGKCEAEKALGEEATNFAKSVIKAGDTIQVNVIGWGKWGGRFIGEISVNGEDFAQMQIDRGYAKPYDGGTKTSWCE